MPREGTEIPVCVERTRLLVPPGVFSGTSACPGSQACVLGTGLRELRLRVPRSLVGSAGASLSPRPLLLGSCPALRWVSSVLSNSGLRTRLSEARRRVRENLRRYVLPAKRELRCERVAKVDLGNVESRLVQCVRTHCAPSHAIKRRHPALGTCRPVFSPRSGHRKIEVAPPPMHGQRPAGSRQGGHASCSALSGKRAAAVWPPLGWPAG